MNINTYQKQWRLSTIGFRIIKTGERAYEIRQRCRHTGEYEVLGGGNNLSVLVDAVWKCWWDKLWRSRAIEAPSHIEYELMLDRAQRDALERLAQRLEPPQSGAHFSSSLAPK